ncbi:MAG: PhoU domain-containing protein [Pseudomonadota bacterium]
MITFDGLSENFRFIILEVQGQLQATQSFMHAPNPKEFKRIISRDDHVDNLKTIIENNCFSRIHTDPSLDKKEIDRIRAMHEIAVYLERIANHCVNILDQMTYLSTTSGLLAKEYDPMFSTIMEAVDHIIPAFESRDLAMALAICRAEHELDDSYKKVFARVIEGVARKKSKIRSSLHDYITDVFVYRYLERIGDDILAIGEALIFASIGERIKIKQFDALQQTLNNSGFESNFDNIDYRSILGSRSGCRIALVRNSNLQADPKVTDDHGTIYKEGNIKKIAKEKRNIERWAKFFPDLVPCIYGYHEQDKQASLLIEFLQGCTFDEIVLSSDQEMLKNALFIMRQTFTNIWDSTKRPKTLHTNYISQIRSRLSAVWRVHPEFYRPSMNMCGLSIPSSDTLLDLCADIEAMLPAPYTVMTHGDCNLNNLVYNHANQTIRLIDLYRSRDYDIVQDVSVFMVSAFRIPIFAPEMRRRILWTMRRTFDFTKDYAKAHDDTTFQARLALGLARSFYTSPRFELKRPFARDMFLRAHFLLEKLHAHRGPWEDFVLPEAVLR